MQVTLCHFCVEQLLDKPARHPKIKQLTDSEMDHAGSYLVNKLAEEVKSFETYPMLQVVANNIFSWHMVLSCWAHYTNPEADCEIFDEWIDTIIEDELKMREYRQ